MKENLSCLACGKAQGPHEGFIVSGQQYIEGLPVNPVVCDFQCLIQWDTTGGGAQENQGFNLDDVELIQR